MNAETKWEISLRSLFVFCALCVVLSLAPAVHAQSSGDELEKEAQAIDRMIMCPVCPAETIDQAQVEISFQMRAVIREMLAEGRSREEILDYFVDRYGPDILAAPPKAGANLLAWILPIVGVALGLAGVFLVIRAMTGRNRTPVGPAADTAPQSTPAATDPELAPYLEIAARLLASRRAAFAGQPGGALAPRDSGSAQDVDPPTASQQPSGEGPNNNG